MDTLDSVTARSNALNAFLRGVERKAAVFAQLQTGDTEQGDRALEASVREFATAAQGLPEQAWAQRFWTILLTSPLLEQEALSPFWGGDLAPLARLESGPRAALLLRLVAKLDDAHAAELVGIDEASYHSVLQAALPQRPEGGADGPAWLAMREEVRYAIEELTVERLAAIARVRDTAIAESAADPTPAQPQAPSAVSRWGRALPTGTQLASGLLGRLRNGLRSSGD